MSIEYCTQSLCFVDSVLRQQLVAEHEPQVWVEHHWELSDEMVCHLNLAEL